MDFIGYGFSFGDGSDMNDR